MNRVYKNVGIAKLNRSVFNLSYQKLMSASMGILYPTQIDEVVPGDVIKMGVQAVFRMSPLVAPILHPIDVTFHTFFWPYRFLTDSEGTFDWEDFITGGVDGDDAQTLPTWEPTDYTLMSLWDYCGFPPTIDPDGAYPMDGPRQAYNHIYNEYYRDETIIDPVDYDNEDLLLRCWEKDFFTSAGTDTQRGDIPTLPIAGITSAVWDDTSIMTDSTNEDPLTFDNAGGPVFVAHTASATARDNARGFFADNTVDLSAATAIDVNDMRLLFQVQKWQERNQRAGARYKEFLLAHYGTNNRDSRLQRPEYIGGAKFPVIISDIPQTSASGLTGGTTPCGGLVGKGTAADSHFIGTYKVREFGLIMTIMSIMPKPVYEQGIDRQWLKETRLDFFAPEFQGLGEQPIIRAELYADGVPANNTTVFGYQGRYDELRTKRNLVCGDLHGDWAGGTLYSWHLSRIFGSAPTLNQTFLECVPRTDPFAAEEEEQFVCSIQNVIKAIRPLTAIANPGFIDH